MSIRRVGLAAFFLVHAIIYSLIRWFGYVFIPVSGELQFFVTLAIIIVLTVDGVRCSAEQTKFTERVNNFLPLIVLFFIRAISSHNSGILYLLLYIASLACSLILFFTRTHNCKEKVTRGTAQSILVKVSVLASCFVLLAQFLLLFLPSGYTGVRQAEQSPSGRYLAEVIENSHGAMGGNTRINITRRGVDFGIGELRARPQNIYHGRWGGSQIMIPHWETDEMLYITHIDDPAQIIMRFRRQWNGDWRRLND